MYKVDVYVNDEKIDSVYVEADDMDHAEEKVRESLNVEFDVEEVGVMV